MENKECFVLHTLLHVKIYAMYGTVIVPKLAAPEHVRSIKSSGIHMLYNETLQRTMFANSVKLICIISAICALGISWPNVHLVHRPLHCNICCLAAYHHIGVQCQFWRKFTYII